MISDQGDLLTNADPQFGVPRWWWGWKGNEKGKGGELKEIAFTQLVNSTCIQGQPDKQY